MHPSPHPWPLLALLAALLPALLLMPAPAAGAAAAAEPPSVGAVWPLPGRPAVVRGFDPPPQPWLPGHRGIDLAAAAGSPVLSPIAGTVVFAGTVVDRGVVVIAAGRLRVSLEPVDPLVPVGAPVRAGAVVGTLAAGSHCRVPHCLHWGLRVDSRYRDPRLLVVPLRPVLLPLTEPAGRR